MPGVGICRFAGLRRVQESATTTKGEVGGKKDRGSDDANFTGLLSKSASLGEAANHIADAITNKLAEMFKISEEEFDQDQSLSKYGVDSLTAVELRNWLVNKTQTDISIFDMLQSLSLRAVAEKAAVKSRFVVKAGLVKA